MSVNYGPKRTEMPFNEVVFDEIVEDAEAASNLFVGPPDAAYNSLVIPGVHSLAGEAWLPPPNGIDDTTAMDSLSQAIASSINPKMLIRAYWGTYFYNGAGFNGSDFNIRGVGGWPGAAAATPAATAIVLGAASYLIDTASVLNSLLLEDVGIFGGKGAFHSSYVGGQGDAPHRVAHCYFQGHTLCAVGHNNPNMPFWKFEDCTFYGAAGAMDVALAGQNDGTTFRDCRFWTSGINVKLGTSHRTSLDACDFTFFAAGNGRIMIWVVPFGSDSASVPGLTAARCNFGQENQGAADFRVVYADEIVGADFTTNQPNLAADSVGIIHQHNFDNCVVVGAQGVARIPFIYSTTPNLEALRVTLKLQGVAPSYIVQVRTPVVALNTSDRMNKRNVFGPFQWASNTVDDPTNTAPPPITNQRGLGLLFDPSQMFVDDQGVYSHQYQGADPGSYVRLFTGATRSATLDNGTTRADITDMEGRADACEFTIAGVAQALHWVAAFASFIPGIPIWLEFDLKQGSGAAITSVLLSLVPDSVNQWRRTFTVPATWTTYRVRVDSLNAIPVSFVQLQLTASGAGTVDVGRVRLYHAREPIPYAVQFATASTDKIAILADGVTVTPDVSTASHLRLTAAASPRTIAAPITSSGSANGLIIGMRRTFEIINNSGGALTVTWNAVFKMAAWAAINNGLRRLITFMWDGTNWVENWRSAVDF